MPRARRGCTPEHLQGITISGLHFKEGGKRGGAAPGLTAVMERGRPTEGEEVDESGTIREMAAPFPPGGHLWCEDGRAGRTKIRTDRGLAVHDSTIILPGGATQVTAGCRVPSPKPRHLDTKHHHG